MSRRRAVVTVAVVAVLVALAACGPVRPPGRAASGPGSTAGYIATSVTETATGSGSSGTRVWTFTPDRLRGGTRAPVVVVLHGFQLLAPEIYGGLIDHLTRQGVIVVFPQFNKGGFGIIGDTDQNAMLARAIAATNGAIDALGTTADRSQVYLYGHSLGGLMAASWTARGGIAPRAVVAANPSTDAGSGIPAFVRPFVSLTPLPYRTLAPQTTAPTVILTGDHDTIAPPSQSLDLADALTGAASRPVLQLRADDHGTPAIEADHMAPIQSQGIVPDVLMDAFGGDAEDDVVDWRFYEAALDQVMAGTVVPTFDLGRWSDGVAVAPVVRLR